MNAEQAMAIVDKAFTDSRALAAMQAKRRAITYMRIRIDWQDELGGATNIDETYGKRRRPKRIKEADDDE